MQQKHSACVPVCVFFRLHCSFHPSRQSEPSARASSSCYTIIEGEKAAWSQTMKPGDRFIHRTLLEGYFATECYRVNASSRFSTGRPMEAHGNYRGMVPRGASHETPRSVHSFRASPKTSFAPNPYCSGWISVCRLAVWLTAP